MTKFVEIVDSNGVPWLVNVAHIVFVGPLTVRTVIGHDFQLTAEAVEKLTANLYNLSLSTKAADLPLNDVGIHPA